MSLFVLVLEWSAYDNGGCVLHRIEAETLGDALERLPNVDAEVVGFFEVEAEYSKSARERWQKLREDDIERRKRENAAADRRP